MVEQPPLTDDDLHDYIDGRLDPVQAAAVEAALAGDPQMAAKVAAFRAQEEAIRQVYDPVLTEPVPAHLQQTIRNARRSGQAQILMRVAASIAIFAIGAAGGWYTKNYFGSQDFLLRPFLKQAILAYQIELTERPEGLEVDKQNETQLSPSYVPANFGAPIRIPTLRRSQLTPISLASGMDSVGARVTVTYKDRENRRRTLFIRRMSAGSDLPVKYRLEEGTPVLYWIDGPLIYVLVGEGSREELVKIAEEIYRSAAVGAAVPLGQPPK